MKSTKEQQQFIKDATTHSDVCPEWRGKIKDIFPKLFKETEFKNGMWIKLKNENNIIVCITDLKNQKSYGFTYLGNWTTEDEYQGWTFNDCHNDWTLATDKEVEEALIKEAKKRGFKEGVEFNSLICDGEINTFLKGFKFELRYNELVLIVNGYFLRILSDNGKWATIIETITKSEAEKQLGKTIKD